jgi:hypothetical protein
VGEIDVTEHERPVALGPRADANLCGLACGRGDELLHPVEHELHRAPRLAGKVHGDRLVRIDVQLGAETAADRDLDDADVLRRDAYDRRHVPAVEERDLRYGVQRELSARVEGRDDSAGAETAVRHVG